MSFGKKRALALRLCRCDQGIYATVLFIRQFFIAHGEGGGLRFLLHVPGDFYEVSVGVPEVDALPGAPGAVAVYDAGDKGRRFSLQLLQHLLHGGLGDEAEVDAAGQGIGGSRLEFAGPSMDIDFTAAEVEGIPAIFFLYFHVQYIFVEMEAFREMAGGEDDMVKV